MNESKQLAVIKSYIKDIKYDMPKKAEELNKMTITKIKNAIGSGIVDSHGIIWFNCSKLHTILRVRTKSDSAYLLESIDNKFKANYNNGNYICWSSLVAIIARRIEIKPDNEYLRLVLSILNDLNEKSEIRLLQLNAKKIQETNVKKLKKTRIKKLKIVNDELTNQKLDKKTAEFSHIRSVTMYPELSEREWNGFIVNKITHTLITNAGVNDEDQLYKLCYTHGWNTSWYNKYKEMING